MKRLPTMLLIATTVGASNANGQVMSVNQCAHFFEQNGGLRIRNVCANADIEVRYYITGGQGCTVGFSGQVGVRAGGVNTTAISSRCRFDFSVCDRKLLNQNKCRFS
jgi:hypothetical protein